jgi:hypothetical protein
LESRTSPSNADLIENQATPLDARVATANVSAENGTGIRLGLSAYEENAGDRATVAVGGYVKGKHVFGMNPVAYTDGADHVAVGSEIDFGNLNATPGGQAYGLLIKSLGGNVGGQGGQAHIQMQAAASSPADNGIVFHVSSGTAPVATGGALITVDGGTYTYGLDLGGGAFTGAAIRLPNGGDIDIQSTTGTKIGTGTSKKIGFWGATPVVKQTVTGSRGANAALASLITALATAGLVVDSSSA